MQTRIDRTPSRPPVPGGAPRKGLGLTDEHRCQDAAHPAVAACWREISGDLMHDGQFDWST